MSPSPSLQAPAAVRRRHRKSFAFMVLCASSLGLGLVVVLWLLFTTVRDSFGIGSMHATARAGFNMSQRSASIGEGTEPYVSVAQVKIGTPAQQIGMLQGDALIRVATTPVTDVQSAWDTVAKLPHDGAGTELTWVPNIEALIGELSPVPIPDHPGSFRARVSWLADGTPAAAAGLREEDLLVSAGGLPTKGSQQAWQAIVVAARAAAGPVALLVERDGKQLTLSLEARRSGRLDLGRGLVKALGEFVTELDEPRYPEQAGLSSAILGSLYIVLVTILFSFPLGIAAAVYLEEYARRGALNSVLQVLIANLAGIPSVVYGIIGLEVIARTLNLGRSILAGGITLGLLILPVMILGCREALRTVPPWVRQAAFAVGATRSQVVAHQVLPYALPGMLTAMILAISRAIGEAAPLLMLGAFLFVTYRPNSLMDTFTVVPLQIFSWATRPQDGYGTIAAASILVLLAILLVLNGTAIFLRNRFQMRW